MNTLLEFMTFTKGIEYLIAIGFVLAFVAFWLIVYGRKGKGRTITLAVLAYLLIGIVLLVGSCVASAPA
ncbi:MAG: hypothetical protein A2Z02_00945 [Chloroflexi bacterium RBG_16_48_7]|nr:MAG: hypothetical protein A2Z02_00945 [Chloroflexi bacterium RBG_16_48_7]